MTIIASSKKFIFVHLHKCGGTSVTQSYAPHAAWNDLVIGATPLGEELQPIYLKLHGLHKHNSASELKKIVGPEVWSEYWTIALVRHPLRIYESFYRWIYGTVKRYIEENKMTREQFVSQYNRNEINANFTGWGATRVLVQSTCFAEFIDIALKQKLMPGTLTSRLSEAGKIIVDNVYKLEEIDRLWDEFEARNALKIARLHQNRSVAQECQWDKAHIEEMYRRFEIDFRTFDYA